MKALVTGANGHIGNHVVRALLEARHKAVAFVRPGSDRRALTGLEVELREGDLLDAATVDRAVAGVDWVFHVGTVHRNWSVDESTILDPAITGTRNVLDAAKRAGVKRVVVTSSGATVGFASDLTKPLDESAPLPTPRSVYSRAKLEAERLALAADGVEVVVVNPSGVFGPRDYRLTPATKAIIGLLQGNPAFLAVCFTDVRDVARGHLLAAEKGKPRERYLLTGDALGPEQGAALFGEVTGIRPMVFSPPRFLLRFLAGSAEKKARKTGQDAEVTRDQIDDAFGHHLVYDSRKAKTELGATFRPAKDVLRDAVRWLSYLDALKPKVGVKVRRALGPAVAPDAGWVR